jgi:L-amino acid N-acyltransferase YncA
MRRRYAETYELVFVGISKYNPRSLHAHQKLGFLHVGEINRVCPEISHEKCESRFVRNLSTDEPCTLEYILLHNAWKRVALND